MSEPTIPTEGQPSEPAPQQPEYGASPEEIQSALALQRGLNNLDTRSQYLQQVVRPDLDGQFLRQAIGQTEEQPESASPFEEVYGPQPQVIGFNPDGTPVFDQPYNPQQQQGFDPYTLEPVLDQWGKTVEQHAVEQATKAVEQRLLAQASEAAVNSGVDAAAKKHNLDAEDRQVVDYLTREAMKTDRAAPADIADRVATSFLQRQAQRFVAQGGALPTPDAPAAPSGPVPAEGKPRTEAEAIAWSRRPGVLGPL